MVFCHHSKTLAVVVAALTTLPVLLSAVPATAAPARAVPGSTTTVDRGTSLTSDAPAGTAAIDPAFPSNWPRWRFQAQNPANHNRLTIDVSSSGGHGTQVQLWDHNLTDAQLWYEEAAAEGGAFLHPAYNRWLCLGRDTTGAGSLLRVQNCSGSVLQRFSRISSAAAREIRSMADNLCVDVPYSNFSSGTPLWLWGCNGMQASQRWIRPAPDRNDGRDEAVYFIHGYHPTGGYNCDGYWGDAMNTMRSWGFTGPFHKVGYYAADDTSSCDTRIANGTTDTRIQELGRLLAWHIYQQYSSRNVSVDLMGHSMGGLIARAAVNGVRNGAPEDANWPPFLYVEDVATLGTPHDGAELANFCQLIHPQCADMRGGSAFHSWLDQSRNPQSTQGTDWSVIGSDDDEIVEVYSALAMDAGHTLWYYSGQGLCHDCLQHTVSGSYVMQSYNYYSGSVYMTGGSPISSAANALHNYWRW